LSAALGWEKLVFASKSMSNWRSKFNAAAGEAILLGRNHQRSIAFAVATGIGIDLHAIIEKHLNDPKLKIRIRMVPRKSNG
jgi:hypothetical protein